MDARGGERLLTLLEEAQAEVLEANTWPRKWAWSWCEGPALVVCGGS